jgi:hypothetical protein
MIAAQLAGLAAVLAAMGAFALYLSRPPSADELYSTVSERGTGDNEAPLGSVEREINKFLELYPQDPRAEELQRYKGRIDLDKLERKLRREARDSGSADPSLLPVEQLYLRAAGMAENSPDEALALFQSLIDLYGPSIGDGDNNDVSAIVQLAKQRLAGLRSDLTKLHERQLSALAERLDVAQQLSTTDSAKAAAMYRAIIDLHQSNTWANEVVAQARTRLVELEKR